MRGLSLGRSAAAAVLALMMLLGVAGHGVSAQDSTPATGADFPVTITFVNAMTALDKVDVYINGDEKEQRVIEGFEYGQISQVFDGTAPGTGVVIKDNNNLSFDRYLFSTLVPTGAGNSYVIVITDIALLPIEMDMSAGSADTANTRAVAAAPQAPAVDVYATPAGTEFSIGNVVPIISGLSYGHTTSGSTVDAGSYDLRLTQTGTDTVALQQDGVTIDGNTSYVFVLIGKPGSTDNPLTVLTVSAPIS